MLECLLTPFFKSKYFNLFCDFRNESRGTKDVLISDDGTITWGRGWSYKLRVGKVGLQIILWGKG